MKIIALLLAFASGSCWAQQQQVNANGQKNTGSIVCNDTEPKCVIVKCFGLFRATDLIDPDGKEYIAPDSSYPVAPGFGAVQVALLPPPQHGNVTVTYYSDFQGQGEVLTVSKDSLEGGAISAMSSGQNPSRALIWGASQGTDKSTWEIYCKRTQ